MSVKIIVFLCAQALLVQIAFSQCTNRAAVDASFGISPGWKGQGVPYHGLSSPARAYDGFGWSGRGVACNNNYPTVAPSLDFTPPTSGGLVVTSSSVIPPTGIAVVSDNAFEGALAVTGEAPFVGTTAIEGLLPAAGTGEINHACGDGVSAVVSDSAFAPDAAVAVEPIVAEMTPSVATSPSPITPCPGVDLGNRYGHRGCGNRGLMY